MKIIMLMLVFPFVCHSQSMDVIKKDGSSESYTLSDVKNIIYSYKDCNMSVGGNNARVYLLEEIRKVTFANVFCSVGINDNRSINNGKQFVNYPNPFSDKTTIEFELSKDETIQLNIYNAQGILIKTLINEKSHKGNNKITWDGRSDEGNMVSVGMYFCQIKMNNSVLTNKMFLIK